MLPIHTIIKTLALESSLLIFLVACGLLAVDWHFQAVLLVFLVQLVSWLHYRHRYYKNDKHLKISAVAFSFVLFLPMLISSSPLSLEIGFLVAITLLYSRHFRNLLHWKNRPKSFWNL